MFIGLFIIMTWVWQSPFYTTVLILISNQKNEIYSDKSFKDYCCESNVALFFYRSFKVLLWVKRGALFLNEQSLEITSKYSKVELAGLEYIDKEEEITVFMEPELYNQMVSIGKGFQGFQGLEMVRWDLQCSGFCFAPKGYF